MGGASVAAFWQENPSDHANPALMGFHRGLRFSFGDTKLDEPFTQDGHFESRRYLAGLSGLGVAITGKPIESMGRLRLRYGQLFATDEDGNIVATFSSVQTIRSVAVGVSVLDVVSGVLEARAEPSPSGVASPSRSVTHGKT
jgi:hypothetical protein